MIIFYSGGDSGRATSPEFFLKEKANIMLSYHGLTEAGTNKYSARFKHLIRHREKKKK